MAKKVSEIEKNEILMAFKKGLSIKELSLKYQFSIATISRHLKNNLGSSLFAKIKNREKNKVSNNPSLKKEIINNTEDVEKNEQSFFEIVPLSENLQFETQKDISSIPLKDVIFPDVVYMIIDKKIELEIKLLKDYGEWQFLSEDDLQRKSIRIFSDQRKAKKICSHTQKLIKVPNSKVFALVANRLISQGISRIIFDELLIAL